MKASREVLNAIDVSDVILFDSVLDKSLIVGLTKIAPTQFVHHAVCHAVRAYVACLPKFGRAGIPPSWDGRG